MEFCALQGKPGKDGERGPKGQPVCFTAFLILLFSFLKEKIVFYTKCLIPLCAKIRKMKTVE